MGRLHRAVLRVEAAVLRLRVEEAGARPVEADQVAEDGGGAAYPPPPPCGSAESPTEPVPPARRTFAGGVVRQAGESANAPSRPHPRLWTLEAGKAKMAWAWGRA